jgi:hypothetical protein
MSLEGWDELSTEEQERRMEEFVAALRGTAGKQPAGDPPPDTRHTKPKEKK